MTPITRSRTRRWFLHDLTVGAAWLAAPGGFAQAVADSLALTPPQTEGPFYPDRMPLDTDNDLIKVNDALTSAIGEITHLGGRVLDADGKPIRNAVVEIWQVDAKGVYLHSRSGNGTRDANFQGYGRFLTGSSGEYYFRTVKPVPYPGRTPHIHFAINRNGVRRLTTQMYIKGEPRNERDGVFGQLDEAGRKAVAVDFKPLDGSKLGELTASFDVVLGVTPEDGGQAHG
jgi:protocatechuate 3,4-dioxygenase beta subunit